MGDFIPEIVVTGLVPQEDDVRRLRGGKLIDLPAAGRIDQKNAETFFMNNVQQFYNIFLFVPVLKFRVGTTLTLCFAFLPESPDYAMLAFSTVRRPP